MMPNRLISEQSPYLLQHAHNPVNWYPWGDEPFERAKNENKPVLVSIGYAACHWCHVMERESFEKEEVAAYMNEHFINIKVDREEHPDVDHLYMDAVQAISGSGGWPLNVFVTPDRIPFFGGTYYPPKPAYSRPSWMELLMRIHEIWTQQNDEVVAQAKQMIDYLQQASRISMKAENASWDMDTCRKIADNLLQQADAVHGGFGNAPKFPGTMAISYLLEHYHFTGYKPALEHALKSLDGMINGGIYDQLGGGFARYATDAAWLVPHFEKMLYDNALLIATLCNAYAVTKKPIYKRVAEETIAFAERELKDAAGGYYSALDADSEGEEGKYYTWTWAEWREVLGEDAAIAAAYFGVTEEGNWDGTNILHIPQDIAAITTLFNQTETTIAKQITDVKRRLMAHRNKRVRPLTDDKSLLSWNALMNLALSQAAAVFANERYAQRATEHMRWMLDHFVKEGKLMHTWKKGIARIDANIDDYAYLIQALLQLASVSGDNAWLLRAKELTERTVADFMHEEGNFFYYTSAMQNDIPVRKVDMYDGATPSANAVMAYNLLLAGNCMGKGEWMEHADFMLQKMCNSALRYPSSFGYWAILLQRYARGMKTIVCTGDGASAANEALQQLFLPNGYIVTSEKEIFDIPVFEGKFLKSELLIFVCTRQACLAPAGNIEEALLLFNH